MGGGGPKNAPLAIRILALQNADLARKMDQFRAGMADTVRAKDKRLQERLSS
ncbi:MAG: hypothetical protein R3F17_17265 [Planctomycetota bacterium]